MSAGDEVMKSGRLRRLAAVVLAGAILLAAALTGLYVGSRASPDFYGTALHVNTLEARRNSDRFLRKVAAGGNETRREGAWSLTLTQDEVNGWLADDLKRNHADLLPASVSEPRVELAPGRLRLAYRESSGPWPIVVSLDLGVRSQPPDAVAITLEKARAGALPLPLSRVLDGMTALATALDTDIRWLHDGGKPVAVLTLPELPAGERLRAHVQSVHLEEGRIHLRGCTSSSPVQADARSAAPAGLQGTLLNNLTHH